MPTDAQANRRRRIAVVTTSRADFGHLIWPLRRIEENDGLELKLIAIGAHLSPEFGHTVDAVTEAGFTVHERVECLMSSDTDTGMAKTIGVAMLGLADVLDRLRPDLLLLIADRYEMLAPASVALALRIPVAHIEGGEISEGAVDDAVRNALTKMAHLHFTPTEHARRRVIAMGEEPWRVHAVGAPSLDNLVCDTLPDTGAVAALLGGAVPEPLCVISVHPVTLLEDTLAEADALFAALDAVDHALSFCFPNADAGSRALVERARALCARRANAHLFVNLDHRLYWALLRDAALLLGNSSSGIMETASLNLPTINIGMRQQGRDRAANVVDVAADRDAIVNAVQRCLAPGYRAALGEVDNPYGDGRAGERIAAALASAPDRDTLLLKRALPLSGKAGWSEEAAARG
ncbi:MAG: UDP-N-acetylglucosamine 2-epimerase [Pseudomonadota bacterium]